jgi:UDP-GlcNAc:undecaprenyl-phosphate GlcNAc-1-phosphate transferase
LLRLGHGHRRAVPILWGWTALLSLAVLIPALTNRGDTLVPLAIGGLALALFTVLHPGARRAREEQAAEAVEEATRRHPVSTR